MAGSLARGGAETSGGVAAAGTGASMTSGAGTTPGGTGATGGAGTAGLAGAGGSPEPELIAEWTLDADASDSFGTNDGQLQGGAQFIEDPLRGPVLSCNGVDAGVVLTNSTPPAFSYTAWLWTSSPTTQGDDPRDGNPILWSNSADSIEDFSLSLLNDRLAYLSYGQRAMGMISLIDGKWHHIALTRQDSARATLYVDGVVDVDCDAKTGTVLANPQLYFCANPVGGHYFQGLLDDVRLYSGVLSGEAVMTLFQTTAR